MTEQRANGRNRGWQRIDRPAGVGWIITATLTGYAAFIIVAFAVNAGWLADIDRRLVLSLREGSDVADPIGPPWFEDTASEITALGGYPTIILIAGLVVGALVLLRRSGAALFLVASLIGGTMLSSGLKQLFSRPRPDIVDHLDRTFTLSFPSGHATMSMLYLLTLAAIASRFVPSRAFRVYAIMAAVIVSILIGTSRVYLGVHWPSDVIAGWALGIGWAGTTWLVAHAITQRLRSGTPLGQSTPRGSQAREDAS
ncbi:MAG: phosphatase PAP2 family protein [Roseitalea sp.]|jgi:undecaprenyl-diphosphatase|nr:phosphatase PAP2 family protein [Roseitalea sp.]MBO6723451.1 phosphatase PAP2 family protein [Roseitalea sp.]MBO6742485.1 phosphatase PAP2 family protein [Roseitalea sp.]